MAASFTFLDLYSFVGSTIAIILGILQIKAYKQDKPIVEIKIEEVHIDIYHIDTEAPDYEPSSKKRGHTDISINANIKNRGRQPVTISKIQFFASDTYFQFIDMHSCKVSYNEKTKTDIDYIRLNSYDSLNIEVFANECDYFNDFLVSDCYILFYVGDQKIKKRIFIEPKEIVHHLI